MGANIKQSTVALLIILSLSVGFLSVQEAIAQTDQATSKLQASSDAVNLAFNAVLDAEKAGVNVTGLLAQINTAQLILAQAENSYRTGDTNTSATQADSILPLLQHVTAAAQSAKQNAIISTQNAFYSTIALTIVGIFMFVLFLFLFWRRVKQKYVERLSDAKPEVVNYET